MNNKFVKIIMVIISFITILVLSLLILEGYFIKKTYLEPWNKNYYSQFDDPRTQLIAHGILAANGHNMQNWKFKYDAENNLAFDLYVDSNRLVREVDPKLTQTVISQGTLFEYMVIAGEQLGYKLNFQIFPDGEYSEYPSNDELNSKRVAKIVLEKTEKTDNLLYSEMFKPDTSRVAYNQESITKGNIDLLKDFQENDYAKNIEFIYVNEGEKYNQLKNIIRDSVKIESGISRVMQEGVDIFRKNESEKNKFRYGFSFEGSALTGFNMHKLQVLLTLFPGMNNIDASKKSFIAQTEMAVDKNSGFILLSVDKNSRVNQFNIGRFYSDIQLQAHTMGLAVQPLSQPIEEYPEMKETYDKIHKTLVGENKTILMLFRIGKPVMEVPKSMRQDVKNFTEK